jgi:hypothetical protein
MDLDEVWAAARLFRPAHLSYRSLPLCLKMLNDIILRPAPIITRRTAGCAASFEMHPRAELAGSRNWVWLMPVRLPDVPFPADLAREALPDSMDELRTFWHMTDGSIVDLVAITPDCQRVVGRMTGLATVLGYPQRDFGAESETVRVFRSLDAWLRGAMQGVVLVGDHEENLAWLNGWNGGIVCDDLAHGKSIDRMLRKQYSGPPVLVAA